MYTQDASKQKNINASLIWPNELPGNAAALINLFAILKKGHNSV